MEFKALNVPVHYVEHGRGTAVLVLHGANVDHREMSAALEPVFAGTKGHRRIYPDLPGMGHTPAPDSLNSGDDVLDLLLAFVDGVIGDEPFLVAGHSAGAYYARAIAGRRPKQASGLALICPLHDNIGELPSHQVMHASVDPGESLDPGQERTYRDYFVVQTKETLERFQKYVAPSAALTDDAGLARIGANWQFSAGPEKGSKYQNPCLIIAGRQDSMVGYAGDWDLLKHYPRATFAVLDRAGHALPHEQPDLLKSLITEWLGRVREHQSE
jgi:pimeloyl-ACP methyl ester carboxylesterase